MCLCRAANQISVQTGLTDKGEFGGKLFSLLAASFFHHSFFVFVAFITIKTSQVGQKPKKNEKIKVYSFGIVEVNWT